jgi:hypothetical protein
VTKHLPLPTLPGLQGLRYFFGISKAPSPYFAVLEADVASQTGMVVAVSSPEGQALSAEVPNYATSGAVVVDYLVEQFSL